MPSIPSLFTVRPERRAFQTPSRKMAAFIACFLLLVYGTVVLTPIFKPGVEFDPALTSTLQNLCILAVGYYLGGSNSSADKDGTIAHQATEAIKAVSAQAGSGNGDDGPVSTIQKIATVSDAAATPVKVGDPNIEVKIDDVVVPSANPKP